VSCGVSVVWIGPKPPKIILLKQNKKHLKNVGPIRYCEPPLHCQSPGVASRTPAIAIAQAACDVHDINNNNNAWQRGPLWPHGMGPMTFWHMIKRVHVIGNHCTRLRLLKFHFLTLNMYLAPHGGLKPEWFKASLTESVRVCVLSVAASGVDQSVAEAAVSCSWSSSWQQSHAADGQWLRACHLANSYQRPPRTRSVTIPLDSWEWIKG